MSELITLDKVKSSIKNLKRRKGIDSNADITITMIAKELGCTRQSLYKRKDLDGVLSPFKKITLNLKDDTINIGTKDYYIRLSQEREKELELLDRKIIKLKNKLLDYHIIEKNLLNSEEKCERLALKSREFYELENENQALRKKINLVLSENEMLRKRLMGFGGKEK